MPDFRPSIETATLIFGVGLSIVATDIYSIENGEILLFLLNTQLKTAVDRQSRPGSLKQM